MQVFTSQNRFVQVGFTDYDLPGGDSVHVTGGVSSVSTLPPRALPAAAQLFLAIDMVGPSGMIALLGSAGPNGRYAFTFAPLEALRPTATASVWEGSGFGSSFRSLASTDSRRAYSSNYVYVVAYTAQAVSSPSAAGADTATSEYQSSGQPVYFVIPVLLSL